MVLIPARDNDGRDFPRHVWRDLEQQFRGFGGFTRAAHVEGEWENTGRVYRDVSRQYIVVLSSWEQLSAWLAVVRQAQVTFGQQAMYIEVAGVPEILGRAAVAEPATGNDREEG